MKIHQTDDKLQFVIVNEGKLSPLRRLTENGFPEMNSGKPRISSFFTLAVKQEPAASGVRLDAQK